MRADALAWAGGQTAKKRASKETLNHRALIERVSGLDVYAHTAEAFHRAYANAVPILSQAVIESPFRKGRNPGSCLPRAAKEGLPRSTCQRWPSHTRTASMSPTILKRPQSAKLEKAIKSNLGGAGV